MKNLALMIIAYLAMVTVNILSNSLPINGQTTQEISDKQTVLFTPAGYVFSIWILIYALLGIWLLLQYRNRNTKQATSEQIATLFILSCVYNIAWLLSWHYEFFAVSVVVMISLLITLILLYKNYSIDNFSFSGRLPFSIYLGWISVATIANIGYTLKHFDVNLGIDEVTITIVFIIIAGALAIIGRYVSRDPYFALVFVWAIIGIARANTDSGIIMTANTVAAIIVIAIIVPFIHKAKVTVTVPS